MRKNEAKTVYDLIEIANENHLLSEEGLPCNLISTRWFNKWKKYTFFHMLSGEKMEQIDETEIEDGLDFGDETSAGEATPTLAKIGKNYPGPIDVSDLLVEEDILIDPDKVKDYCNLIVKVGMEESKDFIIVAHTVFKYLHKIYGGQELKRYVVFINDDSNLTHVEIWLKKVHYFFQIYYFFSYLLCFLKFQIFFGKFVVCFLPLFSFAKKKKFQKKTKKEFIFFSIFFFNFFDYFQPYHQKFFF